MAEVGSSPAKIVNRPERGIRQLNDSLWEFYDPATPVAVPEVEIVFFHGLQWADYQEAFWKTWVSRDETVIWPKDWLSKRFPKARILSISYDSSGTKHPGSLDPYLITENLIQDMIQCDNARVGQNCPVVLVGHSFGGLVMKQVILGCVRMGVELDRARSPQQVARIERFLRNCDGVFYYSTPHGGSRLTEKVGPISGLNAPLMNLVKTLSSETARINESFAQARANYGIRTGAIGESLETNYMGWNAKVVEEASARRDIDGLFYTAPQADHFNVCKPKDNRTCAIFKNLVRFVDEILDSDGGMVVVGGDQCRGLPRYAVELDNRARNIKELLKGKTVIGISGMGGVGKTTLAKKVYNNISYQFEYTCFAENAKTREDLNDWLLRNFHCSGKMDKTPIQWLNLNGKKTLIVMDDVDSVTQLRALPELKEFGDGSRIILTSRNEAIFTHRYPDEIFKLYKVDFLEDDQAEKLFCLYAFDKEEIPDHSTNGDHFNEIVKAVVKKCGGLPLTLEVMGCYLRQNADPDVWKGAIDRLTKAQDIGGEQDDRVWAPLKLSYDNLGKDEQCMFIEAGTFFFGRRMDEVLSAWSTRSDSWAKITWSNLVTRSMVKVSQDKTVWMHEQLRDLAWKLADNDILNGANEEANKLVDKLNSKQVKATTSGLKLESRHLTRPLQLGCLVKLENLKYLHLKAVKHKGSGKNFPRTLSLLNWEVQDRSPLPISLTQVKDLAALELSNWYVPEGFPEELANLTKLRYLTLSTLEKWTYFGTGSVPTSLPEALGSLTNLRYLNLCGLTGLHRLPENFGELTHLHHVSLFYLHELEGLPNSFASLSQLKRLDLHHVGLRSLPENFGNLSRLEHLKLELLLILEELPESFGKLSSLESLTVKCCDKLASLPSSFGCGLKSLKKLVISDLLALKCLPDSFGSLSALEDLSLSCTNIERLPHSFSQLSRLQRLSLKYCRRLKHLGDAFGDLSALQYLNLEATGIERLPESFERLKALEELRCVVHKARLLPDKFFGLKLLRSLSIRSPTLERLPEGLGQLALLEELHLLVDNVNNLPTSFEGLSSLQVISIKSKKVEKLPDIASLHSLRKLEVSVPSIRCLPDNIQQWSSLREFVFNCEGHEWMPDHFERLPFHSLSLVLKGKDRLPEGVGKLSFLEDLTLDFDNLKSLPEELWNLSFLRKLQIKNWMSHGLPDSFGRLSSLREIYLIGNSLESLPDSLGDLSSLRKLSLGCPMLKSLPDSLGRLTSLTELSLYFCKPLKRLPDSLGRLTSLRVLALYYCENLKSLPNSLGSPLPSHGGKRRSLGTTATAKTSELEIRVTSCEFLDKSTMACFGWVEYQNDHGLTTWFRRGKRPPSIIGKLLKQYVGLDEVILLVVLGWSFFRYFIPFSSSIDKWEKQYLGSDELILLISLGVVFVLYLIQKLFISE